MIHPRKTKFRKSFAMIIRRKSKECKELMPTYGTYALKADETGFLKESQIEAAKKTVRKILKKRGKIWLDIFANVSITAKPAEVRMGRGKGMHSFWGGFVKEGKIIIEVRKLKRKVRNGLLKRALLMGGSKLPLKTSVIKYNI